MNDFAPCPTTPGYPFSNSNSLAPSNTLAGNKIGVQNGMERRLLAIAADGTASKSESIISTAKTDGEREIEDFKEAVKMALKRCQEVLEGKSGAAAEKKISEKLSSCDDIEF